MTQTAPTGPASESPAEADTFTEPRAASGVQRVLAQGGYETLAMLKNGEQLMLNIAFPVMALFALRYTSFLDSYAEGMGTTRMNVAVPGVLALCVISTALSGQAVQFVLVSIVGFGLGWRPDIFQMYRSLSTLLLGAAAFTALGLFIAGTVRAEATLAIVNIAWVILAGAGGVLIPIDSFPEVYRVIVSLLPSGALGEAMRGDYLKDVFLPLPHLVLLGWALIVGFIASRKFKWSD